MPHGPIFQNQYHPQFSGHETFPLRYGWLKKAYDAVAASENMSEKRSVFLADDAIARFGVGKNMVTSIRHWATAIGIIDDHPSLHTTELGRKLFGPGGIDPYMEHPSTLWLLHWRLASYPEKTTWFWVFNYYTESNFERDQLIKAISKLAADRGWPRISGATIKSDVGCFIRTYVPTLSSYEDILESPLAELGLIKPTGKRDGFRLVRGPKPSLGDGTFIYALLDFWARFFGDAATLSFEAIAHEPGSPGRVFLLDENDVADRLASLEAVTEGLLQWSETTGLKQVVRPPDLDFGATFSYLEKDYVKSGLWGVA